MFNAIYRKLCCWCALASLFLLPLPVSAATATGEAWLDLGKSALGQLYADTNSVRPYKQGGQMYVSISAWEKYTNPDFLVKMRATPGLEDFSSELVMYMIELNNQGRYFVAGRYFLDSKELVCQELPPEPNIKYVGKNPELRKLYIVAMKVARKQAQTQR